MPWCSSLFVAALKKGHPLPMSSGLAHCTAMHSNVFVLSIDFMGWLCVVCVHACMWGVCCLCVTVGVLSVYVCCLCLVAMSSSSNDVEK